MEQENDIILNTKYDEIKTLLLAQKYKETEDILKKELIENYKKIDAQLWVYLGQVLMYQGFGIAAAHVFNRAWLLDPNAQWVDAIKGELANITPGSNREDINKLLEISKVSVTAGIIIKNEEGCVEKCIKALVNSVDEILLIDTGSSDRTIEIAKKYKQVKIINFEWCDDFAAARNFGLNSIKTDWVLWIDADEELVEEDSNAIREVAGIFNDFDEPWLIRIGILNIVGNTVIPNFDVNRMFKISSRFKFHGIVHEQLFLPDKYPAKTISVKIRVVHDGYSNENMKSKNKLERNLKLLKKMVEIGPDDAGTLLFYGRELFARGEFDKSEEILLRAEAVGKVSNKTGSFGRLLQVYDILMEIYIRKNEIDNVEKICKKALEENENYPNAIFFWANIQAQKAAELLYEAGENTKRAKDGFLKYRGLVSPNNQILEWQADLLLADLQRNTGNFYSALKSYEKLATNKICGTAAIKQIESIKNEIRMLYDFQNILYSDVTNYDDIGNDIFEKQQKEYTKEEILKIIDGLYIKPLISIIMPIYQPQLKWLIKAIESLQAQYYYNWELCAVDDGSKDGSGVAIIERIAENDHRIRLVKCEKNGGISSASNISLTMCRGEYAALMDQDDEVTPDALFWIVMKINENKNVEFIYTDECKIEANDNYNRSCFFLKPDWSPSLLINYMYTGHLTVYKTELIRRVGGFRSEFDFSQDYDLALRIGYISKKVVHLERILYYWRRLPTSAAAGAKNYARIANIGALHDWYKHQGFEVVMEKRDRDINYGRLKLDSNLKVSIIIPTDSFENLKLSIQGLITQTSYTNIEIIPVTNSKVAEDIEIEYSYLDCLKICHYNKVYNFSDKCNEGAKTATGSIVIFYNDDVTPITRDWIEKQIEILQLPNVGGVSPLLLHEDNTIQYAGLITGTPGLIGTAFYNRNYLNPVANPFNHLVLRDVSILNGAVIVMKRDIFFEIGGFDSLNTPNGHSDLDLSLKLLEKNYRCIYTPYAILTHVGNHSWAKKGKADKSDIYCLKRWSKYLERDMYFTDSMKTMLYGDFNYNYHMYFPKNMAVSTTENSRDILFISHEMTRTGAPIVLKEMVKVAIDNGDFPVVLCPIDGPLKQEYLDMGVTVIIDEAVINGHCLFERFARNFDLVVANTLACFKAIELLENSLPPVLWWIHEGSFITDILRTNIPNKLGENIKVFCGGDYALHYFKKLGLMCETSILNYGVPDISNSVIMPIENGKITFLLVGTYEKRKGQDIFVKAIQILDEKYKGKAEYIFMGNIAEQRIFDEVRMLANINQDVKVFEPVTREELFKIYKKVTCVVSPSRDDPMPVVMTEAMMMSKICICSDHTGTASYIKDSENGFVFGNENSKEFAEKIAYIIDNNSKLDDIRKGSRRIYEKNFTMEHFENKTKDIMEQLLLYKQI